MKNIEARAENAVRRDAATPRSKAWGILFLACGLFNVADWLYGGMGQSFRLLTGLGFLLLAPEAFRNPVSLTMPLRQAFKPRPRASGWCDWAAAGGVVLLIAAVATRWL